MVPCHGAVQFSLVNLITTVLSCTTYIQYSTTISAKLHPFSLSMTTSHRVWVQLWSTWTLYSARHPSTRKLPSSTLKEPDLYLKLGIHWSHEAKACLAALIPKLKKKSGSFNVLDGHFLAVTGAIGVMMTMSWASKQGVQADFYLQASSWYENEGIFMYDCTLWTAVECWSCVDLSTWYAML